MNTSHTILDRLKTLGVLFSLDGDELCLKTPPGVLTPTLRAELRQHKPAIIAHLAGPLPPLEPLHLVEDKPLQVVGGDADPIQVENESWALTNIQQAVGVFAREHGPVLRAVVWASARAGWASWKSLVPSWPIFLRGLRDPDFHLALEFFIWLTKPG